MVTGRSTSIDAERLHRDPSNSHSRPTAVIRLGDLIVQKRSLSLASVVRCDVQHRWRQVDAPFGNGSLTLLFVKVTEMREKLFLTRLAEDETIERQPALEPLQVYLIAGQGQPKRQLCLNAANLPNVVAIRGRLDETGYGSSRPRCGR